MTAATFIVGAILTATGLVSFGASGWASVTALIPSGIGALLLLAGLTGLNKRVHRHAIHAALAVSLLGAIGTVSNVLQLGALVAGSADRPIAVVASTVTFVALVVYLALGVTSFARARRYRALERGAA